jgi:hypothetical protein
MHVLLLQGLVWFTRPLYNNYGRSRSYCLLSLRKSKSECGLLLMHISSMQWQPGCHLLKKLTRWTTGKSLGSKDLLSLWFQVRVMWLLIWWSLETYMVVNFRVRGIGRSARKLVRTPTSKQNKKSNYFILFESRFYSLKSPLFFISKVYFKKKLLFFFKLFFVYVFRIVLIWWCQK